MTQKYIIFSEKLWPVFSSFTGMFWKRDPIDFLLFLLSLLLQTVFLAFHIAVFFPVVMTKIYREGNSQKCQIKCCFL